MSRERAINIVNNLNTTIAKMHQIDITIHNEQFPPARADKKILKKMASKLIKKYNLQEQELSRVFNN